MLKSFINNALLITGLTAAGALFSQEADAQRMTRAEHYRAQTEATQNKLMTEPVKKTVDMTGNCPIVEKKKSFWDGIFGNGDRDKAKEKARRRHNSGGSVNHMTVKI